MCFPVKPRWSDAYRKGAMSLAHCSCRATAVPSPYAMQKSWRTVWDSRLRHGRLFVASSLSLRIRSQFSYGTLIAPAEQLPCQRLLRCKSLGEPSGIRSQDQRLKVPCFRPTKLTVHCVSGGLHPVLRLLRGSHPYACGPPSCCCKFGAGNRSDPEHHECQSFISRRGRGS